MRPHPIRTTLAALAIATAAHAGGPTGVTLDQAGADSGAAAMTGGTFALFAVVGQPDVGPPLTLGALRLDAGFLNAVGGASPPPPCPGDVNGDLAVDFTDLNILLDRWADNVTPGNDGDLSGDGFVNFDDLNLLLDAWGQACN